MPNVYAAVFDDKIVKFGKSSNPYKRIMDHVTSAKDRGALLSDAFISCVTNDHRDELLLLAAARENLEQCSQEQFYIDRLDQVAEVFRDCRIPFILFKVTNEPYTLSVDKDSFTEYLADRDFGTSVSVPTVYRKILDAARGLGEFRQSEIHARVTGVSRRKCDEVLIAMQKDGFLTVRKPVGLESYSANWRYRIVETTA